MSVWPSYHVKYDATRWRRDEGDVKQVGANGAAWNLDDLLAVHRL